MVAIFENKETDWYITITHGVDSGGYSVPPGLVAKGDATTYLGPGETLILVYKAMDDSTWISLNWGYGADVNPPAGWTPMVDVVPIETYEDGTTNTGDTIESSYTPDQVIS